MKNFMKVSQRILLAASMACSDFRCLEKTIKILEKANVNILHFDFCDGHFAPTFQFSPMILKSIRPITNLTFDVHLYCNYPSRYLKEIKECGADVVVVHIESKDDYRNTVRAINRLGLRAGIGVLPKTTIPEDIEKIFPHISLIVVNTVGPAFSGQEFNKKGLDNIVYLKEKVDKQKHEIDIAADGGVNIKTLKILLESGVNILTCGSTSIFRNNQVYEDGIKMIRKEISNYSKNN